MKTYAMVSPYQKKHIWKLCSYDAAYKKEMVQGITGDDAITSVSALTFEQANSLINQMGGNAQGYSYFGFFDYGNEQHRYILSLCYQLDWVVLKNGKPIPNTEKLGRFIATRTKTKKPLLQQTIEELSATIISLEAALKWKK